MEQTFIMIKPDGVQRALIGEIVKRLEEKGLQLVASKLMKIRLDQAEQHYQEHQGKTFFQDLLTFITSGPVFAMVWQGDQAVALSRLLIGKTNPLDAAPGTIRGDFALHTGMNIIHGSDSKESADREIAIFFERNEILTYTHDLSNWI
ncbi:MAG: ndk [Bacilli bacterium]|nr:ndk [Bacilli bacterium]